MQPGVQSIGIETSTDPKARISVLEVQDIDDFLTQADMANREFMSEKEGVVLLDETGRDMTQRQVHWQSDTTTTTTTDFVFKELSVPRRPAWDEAMSKAELDASEKEAFLDWRRSIAQREEQLLLRKNSSITQTSVTPFEKNLEVWRQLWRVLERSSCLIQLVDARNPLFYLSRDLQAYAQELGKPMMVLINKSDYLTPQQRQNWADYLIEQNWEDPVFFSAVQEQDKIDQHAQHLRRQQEAESSSSSFMQDESSIDDSSIKDEEDHHQQIERTNTTSRNGRGIETPLTRQELIDYMLQFAKRHNCECDPRFENRIQFGMVGFPNVGKSSVINVLVGSSKHAHGVVRVGVASQPGKTKHFQTLFLPDCEEMMLCDCPGLVFPSFVSNTADLIAAGVYPIAQMRDHWPVTNLITERIPREILNATYGIDIPVKLSYRQTSNPKSTTPPPPTGEEFLRTLCEARGMLAAGSGVPDYTRSSRMVIKDYASGKLLYCHAPPSVDPEAFHLETIAHTLERTDRIRKRMDKIEAAKAAKDDATGPDSVVVPVDNEILALMGKNSEAETETKNNKKHHKKPKKKGRKGRHEDPYGCHVDPEERFDGVASSGVVVKAGKYSREGYTRPTGYGQARSVVQ